MNSKNVEIPTDTIVNSDTGNGTGEPASKPLITNSCAENQAFAKRFAESIPDLDTE